MPWINNRSPLSKQRIADARPAQFPKSDVLAAEIRTSVLGLLRLVALRRRSAITNEDHAHPISMSGLAVLSKVRSGWPKTVTYLPITANISTGAVSKPVLAG